MMYRMMYRRYWSSPLVAGALFLPGCTRSPASSATSVPLAFTGVTVVDVATGQLLPKQTVLIVGSRIRTMGPTGTVRVPGNARVVSATGKYLIPGLWDMHAHTGRLTKADAPPDKYDNQNQAYPLFILNGVTGVREMGSAVPMERVRHWRRAIAAGELVGPRIVATGRYISNGASIASTDMAYYVKTAAEARAVVDSIKAEGADFIKVHEIGSREAFFALAAAARRAGLPLAGHLSGPGVTVIEASDSGQRSIEHTKGAGLCDSVPGCTMSTLAAHFRRNGTWLLPGGGGQFNDGPPAMCRGADTVGCLRRPVSPALDWTVMPFITGLDNWPGFYSMPGLKTILDQPPNLFTDFYLPGQLAILVAAGMTPLAALQAATLNPAKYLDATDSLGTVAPGKLADLLLLAGNPLTDIWNVEKIEAVVANGRYWDQAALNDVRAKLIRDATEYTARNARAQVVADSTTATGEHP